MQQSPGFGFKIEPQPKRVLSRYSRSAKATFKKDRRLNIRISTKDLEAIQKRALEEDFPTKL